MSLESLGRDGHEIRMPSRNEKVKFMGGATCDTVLAVPKAPRCGWCGCDCMRTEAPATNALDPGFVVFTLVAPGPPQVYWKELQVDVSVFTIQVQLLRCSHRGRDCIPGHSLDNSMKIAGACQDVW